MLSERPGPIATGAPNRRNILIVGEVGVGKSSLVNLITGQQRAITSNGARSCTLQSQEHITTLGSVQLALHDTAGLHEAVGRMKMDAYLDAVHQAYTLISKLESSGGISLLLFCMKGGRISMTMQQTYNLFVEVLCNYKVPVVIAVTHLEGYDCMEEWWIENEKLISEYGLKSIGHACITATPGYRNMFMDKYEQSRETMKKLLLDYSNHPSWKEEKANWVKRMMLHIHHWLPARRANRLDGSGLKKKLIKRCGFSAEDAEVVARKIEQSRGTTDSEVGSDASSSWLTLDEKFGVAGESNSYVSFKYQ
ncbi:hypothetical protein PAXINDRAFT_70273 [Paxillus involutus ATCC 200175]|nr:hypothetical protein PAXINDRAFT_70273 [Paxillus involutus ATCC 200175]